nr:MAG TPA: hypothetical protein [Caudoviricetes sp.]
MTPSFLLRDQQKTSIPLSCCELSSIGVCLLSRLLQPTAELP